MGRECGCPGRMRMIKGYTVQRTAAVAIQKQAQREKQRREERQSRRQTQGKNPAKARTTTARVKGSADKGRTKRALDATATKPQTDITAQVQSVMQPQGFPILIPEQLRSCLMAREDVEAAVRKVFQEVQDRLEEAASQRKVYLSEAMERLNVKSRSTMWHWNERGYLIQSHDDNGHVFYPDYKIRRAERGEHPEKGGEDDE